MATTQAPSTIQYAYSMEGERTTLTAVVFFDSAGNIALSGSGLQQWTPNSKPTPTNVQPGTYSMAKGQAAVGSVPGCTKPC